MGNLASAYGIAVSATMLATSALLFIAMRAIWGWSLLKAGAIASVFIIIDAAFFAANFSKIAEGGYVPLILAALIYGIMFAWHKGTRAVIAQLNEAAIPINVFMTEIVEKSVARVDGTAIFFTITDQDTPPVMMWHVRQNRALHRQLFILKVSTRSVPWVKDNERLMIKEIATNVWRATADYGFMEQPNIPALLKQAHAHGCPVDLKDVTYYIGHETIIPRDDVKALTGWVETAFAFMQRNSLHSSDYFQLPSDQVVEIGRQIAV